MDSKDRINFIDRIKVFACILVVVNHSISSEWVKMPSGTNDITWYILNLVFLFTKASIPLFFMCSGALMLNKDRDIRTVFRKNIFFVLKIYAVWMLIYGIVDVIKSYKTVTPRTAVNMVIKSVLFGHYHTWFIAALLGLYLITPLLKVITDHRDLERYYLLLSVLFTILIPYIGRIAFFEREYNVINDISMQFVIGDSLYYVAGHYLLHTPQRKHEKPFLIALLAVSTVAAYIISNLAAESSAGGDVQLVYSESSFAGFLISVCLFRLIQLSDHRLTQKKHTLTMTRTLCSYGFAIYLMHPLFLGAAKAVHGLAVIPAGIMVWLIAAGVSAIIAKTPLSKVLLGVKQ